MRTNWERGYHIGKSQNWVLLNTSSPQGRNPRYPWLETGVMRVIGQFSRRIQNRRRTSWPIIELSLSLGHMVLLETRSGGKKKKLWKFVLYKFITQLEKTIRSHLVYWVYWIKRWWSSSWGSEIDIKVVKVTSSNKEPRWQRKTQVEGSQSHVERSIRRLFEDVDQLR